MYEGPENDKGGGFFFHLTLCWKLARCHGRSSVPLHWTFLMINTKINVCACQWNHGEELTPQNVPEIHQGGQPVQLTSWEKKKHNKGTFTLGRRRRDLDPFLQSIRIIPLNVPKTDRWLGWSKLSLFPSERGIPLNLQIDKSLLAGVEIGACFVHFSKGCSHKGRLPGDHSRQIIYSLPSTPHYTWLFYCCYFY